jgi:hypothetical protein
MALNTVFKLRTRGHLFNQQVEFGVHIQQVLSSGGAQDLAGSWTANVMPLVFAATSASVNWDELVISDVSPGTDLTIHFGFTQPNPGLIAGDCLPGQNAVVVQEHSLVKGRRHRGRFYLPGIAESGTTNALLTGSQSTAIANLASQLIVFYGPAGTQTSYRLVIFSPPTPPFKPKKQPPVHTDTLITPVNNATVDSTIRTQRRRMIGVGR